MILIRKLLESNAAQRAKEMGLDSAAFGRWKKNGVVTHKTDPDGNLVPVKGDSSQSPTANGPKPTGMSAQQAGTAPSNVPDMDDVTKRQDDSRKDAIGSADKMINKKDAGGADGAQEQLPPPQPKNPFRPKDFHPNPKWGKVVSSKEELDAHFEDADPYQLRREMVVGETVVIASSNEDLRKIVTLNDGMTDRELSARADAGTMSAQDQDRSFRKQLPDTVYDSLIKVQNWWQESPQFDRPEEQRQQANAFLNSVANHYKPAIQSEHPIERGVRIHAGEIEEFLQKFAIGEDLDMPPSGFSTNPSVARTFGSPLHDKVGVIMRIHPSTEGKIHGMALTNVNVPKEKKELREKYRHTQMEYGHEQEIIRPSGPKARCLNVTKVMSKPKDSLDAKMAGGGTFCLYMIDMEDRGYQDDLQESRAVDDIENPIFTKYMNTGVNTEKKTRNIKLSNMMSSDETP